MHVFVCISRLQDGLFVAETLQGFLGIQCMWFDDLYFYFYSQDDETV